MKKIFLVLVVAITYLIGCANVKAYDVNDLVESLKAEGIKEDSIHIYEASDYDRIMIKGDCDACIYVYKNSSNAKKDWDDLSLRYKNLEYEDDVTAVGDLKDVYDVSIANWVHYDNNVIVEVCEKFLSEWAVYNDESGEQYYEDGQKVSDGKGLDEQKNDAAEMKNMILNCLK